jgi:hypothetical protein
MIYLYSHTRVISVLRRAYNSGYTPTLNSLQERITVKNEAEMVDFTSCSWLYPNIKTRFR